MMIDLDAKKMEGRRPKPDGELEEVQIGKKHEQTTRVNKDLPTMMKRDLVAFLRSNADLFAWTAANMPGINPEFMSHQLSIFPGPDL